MYYQGKVKLTRETSLPKKVRGWVTSGLALFILILILSNYTAYKYLMTIL